MCRACAQRRAAAVQAGRRRSGRRAACPTHPSVTASVVRVCMRGDNGGRKGRGGEEREGGRSTSMPRSGAGRGPVRCTHWAARRLRAARRRAIPAGVLLRRVAVVVDDEHLAQDRRRGGGGRLRPASTLAAVRNQTAGFEERRS